MLSTSRRTALALLGMLVVLVACRREEAAVGKPESPVVLVLSSAHGKSPERVARLERFVEEHSGLALEIHVAKSGEEAVRMAGTPNTDAALLTLFEYLFAHKQFAAEAALQVVRKDGAKSYEGEILVRRDSGHDSLTDLQGAKIAYVDRYSTTGFLLPAKKLADAGVRVEPVFTGSHQAALDALSAGRVAAAAVYRGAAKDDASVVAIAKTDRIPNEPLAYRAGFDADKRRRINAALVAFAATPEGSATLAEMADITGFTPVSSSEYDAAFTLIQAAGKSVKDLVPRGWLLANERERAPADLAP